ncbi:SnoaL-like domain protein [Brevundimonas sp. SH203]|uniref:nuclear transport factor 2 family protein n=1 Tax=Brevundimonas sp. SH203 TaxID=345167 RepID=UPI0009CF0FB2|nr:nuclear transport factor 2 family protein [Brevundimonas sp. SH203]GAW40313.1 SnoaL-like domain protein [Brevundimonas sp. SH203]
MDALLVAEALSHAITTRDVEAVDRLYTDETVVWHSYDRQEQDRQTTLAFLMGFFDKADEIRYTDIRRARTEDGYVQQHVIHTTLKDGTQFEPRPVCIVAKVENGKVLRVDEYLESRRIVDAKES